MKKKHQEPPSGCKSSAWSSAFIFLSLSNHIITQGTSNTPFFLNLWQSPSVFYNPNAILLLHLLALLSSTVFPP